ncbi:MAG: Gfo/Idh/MocA family oxidoreductase [Lachnospiraceae bacterium]|nr:Gfo/Idh/MocA family oxidoreductase [Lachnospiraceae bacterium]
MKIGILGAGNIATTMATTLQSVKDAECYAVASRDINKARDFANKYGFEKAYGSYSDMLSDPYVQLVYIATPHSHHYEHIKLCLDHGKHVICEKAFTANAAQAEEVIRIAEERGLFITEAIWTRYMPMRDTINRIVRSGIIGNPTSLSANLGYPLQHIRRMVKPELAGGALLDLGVYVINFASMVFGDEISSISAECIKYDSGVDAQETIMFSYADGRMASLYVTMLAQTDRRGIINGTNGYIEIENINNYESIRVFNLDRKVIAEYAAPLQITGYEYEIVSSMNAIRAGDLECREMPHFETIRMMQIMDSIREAWGIRFPFEKKDEDSDKDGGKKSGEDKKKTSGEEEKKSASGKKNKQGSRGNVRMITEQTVKGGISKELPEGDEKSQGQDDDEIQRMIRSIPTPPIDRRGEKHRRKDGVYEDDAGGVIQYFSKPVEDVKARRQGMRAESLDEMRSKLNKQGDGSEFAEEPAGGFLGEVVLNREEEVPATRLEFIDEGVADEIKVLKRGGSAREDIPKKAGNGGEGSREKDTPSDKPIETIVDDSLFAPEEEPKKKSAIGRFFDSVFKGSDIDDAGDDAGDDYGEDE